MLLLKKISDISVKTAEKISVILLLLMLIIICYQVFLRFVLNSPTSWSEELSLIFLAWFGYLGIAIGVKERKHLSIDYLYDKFPQPIRKILDTTYNILIIILSIMMIINGKMLVLATIPQKLPATGLSKATLYSTLIISGLLMLIYSVQNIVNIYACKTDKSVN